MFIVDLTYLPAATLSPPEQHAYGAHRAYLAAQYQQEIFLASGPKIPMDGDIILVSGGVNRETLSAILAADPLLAHGLVQHRVTEFEPLTRHPVLNYVL